MPAKQFFMMLDETLSIRAQHYRELCAIAAIPAATSRHYEALDDKYKKVIFGVEENLPEKPKLPVPTLQAGSTEATNAVISIFSVLKGMYH